MVKLRPFMLYEIIDLDKVFILESVIAIAPLL
jgi:hypothetical protein